MGFGKSFLTLLSRVDSGDFWAFSDQDDIWHEKKISWAVEWLEQQDRAKPCLFCSSYELVTANGKEHLGYVYPPKKRNIDFRYVITDCVYQGFTMTFNRSLRDLILKCDIERLRTHDWWACLLVEKFGIAEFDDRLAVKHRRLDTSLSGMSLKNRLKWFASHYQGDNDIRSCAQEFDRVFGREINDEECQLIRMFSRSSFLNNLKKAFYPRRWRNLLSSEIALRILMITGRV
jgi:rhamnosyltransferase